MSKARGGKKKSPGVSGAEDMVGSSADGGAGSNDAGGGEIPKLDLGKQVLAEQRKITGAGRKGPGKRGKAVERGQEAGGAGGVESEVCGGRSEQDEVIADIVARDIERLGRGDD
ncbi:MAG: hypothetical protein JSU94_08095 [Phycisphaerales bacterium]|nr:MAG: hypothetical protein JSU94_08095 [Phycisphaerales bacterium]